MAAPRPLRLLSHGGRRFLCFCRDGDASPRLQLTDAWEFWSCSVPPEKLHGQEEPASPAGRLARLRELLQGQEPVLTLHDTKATLQVQDGGQSVTFDLDKASLPEARRRHSGCPLRGPQKPPKGLSKPESLGNSKKTPTGVDFEDA
ncbi:protein PAXX isoform X3 [Thamnophis elegans]|uniref:protein PAXX isoform X3 n=1 Tax=Thamnophis elegans TaxID=35005 RepID=UPI0013767334|nr:protein PAXX isoform X3 [Thamnophis elegans]